ncbi:hypothetical protein D9619_002458 [Psilocybe cf. subviscida]|uniref:F-box domain-containing protein n=1 Tax=Psilocybe cf. subviscida TaxID=2480587 RepID=A0A8H5AZC7_9AGAR|nr:hypothetical protein D9619_002458 [Psilocybe cf. subviscida]
MASLPTSVPCIHTPICEACVILHGVDEEIIRITSALQNLAKRRQEVVTTLNRSHDRVTRVPPEITSHIFYLYTHNLEGSNVVKGLFTIALVSKSWRNIVLSTPQLWTSITLSSSGRRWIFPREIAETWLKRSGGLQVNVALRWTNRVPITTSIGHEDPDPPSRRARVGQPFLDILHLLQQNHGRMQHLQLQIPVDILSGLGFRPGCLPKFSLHLDRVRSSENSLRIPSGFKQITCLRIDAELTATNALDLLRQCPFLTEWTSLIVRHHHPDTAAPLRHVLALELSNFDVDLDDMFPLFVNALTIPRLRRLVIKVTSRFQVVPLVIDLSYITGMIGRSTSSLTDFSLQIAGTLDRNRFTIFSTDLHRLSQLRSFSLKFDADYYDAEEGWDPTSTLFQPFLVPKPGPPFLPCLRRFHYSTPRLQPWIHIAAFCKYHSTNTTVRSLSVADFSSCADLLSRGVIDKESLQVFLTLPTTGLTFKFDTKLLAMSIEYHELPTPGDDVLSYYIGLEKSLESVRTFRRRVLWHLNPNTSLNDALPGSDEEMDPEDVSESAKVALHIYGY